jgi:DNA-binding transcriptional LysR family regulator
VTYAVQTIERLLGIKLFDLRGRKAVLTETGRALYLRGRALVDEASGLEHSARTLSAGWEAELRIAVETIFPMWLLLRCLDAFGAESPHTHIELTESVIGGAPEAIATGAVDLAISARVPDGFLGDPLMRVRFIAAAHPDHALHRLERRLALRDLRAHRHLVVRDSGVQRDRSKVSIDAAQRWTVSDMATSIEAARNGLGFAWFPEERIRQELDQGLLKPLPLLAGAERFAELYLVIPDRELAGVGARRLADIIVKTVAETCPEAARIAVDE